MLGLRKVTTGSNTSNTTIYIRNYITVKRRTTKKNSIEFGKRIDFRKLDKVEPIQPKPYTPTSNQLTYDQKLSNISSHKEKKDGFYYSPNFAKLGVLVNENELNEQWDYFTYKPNHKESKGFESGSTFKIPVKSKIEIGKNSSGLSVPFPRISGQGAPLVCVPSMFGQTYNRGMLNNRANLNILDMTTMGQIEQFIKLQIANEMVSTYSIHTTTPGVIACGGLDFMNLYESRKNSHYLSQYFKKVSKMFYLMSIAPKPQLSMIDGLAVGAGLGFTANSGFRIGSENSILTIPDNAIGFFPNAGNIRLLNRLEDGVGLYLALTGRRIRGAELIQAGIIDFLIPTNQIPFLDDALSRLPMKNHERLFTNVLSCTTEASVVLEGKISHLESHREAIKRCFENKTTIEQVIEALENETGDKQDWAERCIKNINRSSPISIKLTMRLFNESPTDWSSKEYFERDYNISMALVNNSESDLWEGIRANLVENREPVWSHKSYKDVTDKMIDDIIKYKPEEELKLVGGFKTTYTMFEDILTEYANFNQVNLLQEDQRILSTYDDYPFTKKYIDFLEIFDKGANSDIFYQDKNSRDVLAEMDEMDLSMY